MQVITNTQHPYRDYIPPVLDNTSRPMWSVMIPTYNCAESLRETLLKVLAQDPGSDIMQIEVVDDHSTKDDPYSVVQEIGKGRVSFYRQPKNVGYIKNFNTCLQRSQGKIVHLLHGDDYVLPGFYQKMELLFTQYPDIGAAFCRSIFMNQQGHWQNIDYLEQSESGVLDNWLEKLASGQRIITPSIVVRRDVYEKIGGFDNRFSCTGEDWEMWVRVATVAPVAYEVEPLAVYRLANGGSLTQNSMRSGKFFQELQKANEIIQSYLPNYLQEEIASKVSKQATEKYSLWAVNKARQAFASGDIKASLILLYESFRYYYFFKVFLNFIAMIFKYRRTSIEVG